MLLTEYHAKYYAHELTRHTAGAEPDRLTMALFDANVDLNPHQIEAALFALRSPVQKGVILADEVGLGKTIEACLVLCQLWAERKRRLLVICPASIRRQWADELERKFNLPATILDSRTYTTAIRSGTGSPFDCGKVVICSLNFAAKEKAAIREVGWNMVVIDEAHKLRNAHQSSNKTGQAIREAVADTRKILLTATPLQNSLMELYGMSSVIDEQLFGDAAAFRALYEGENGDMNALKTRLQSFCKRTLRKDVLEYVQFTRRQAITRPFTPSDEEINLYETLSRFLQREDTFSIPRAQRVLLTMRLRKIMASSSPAIAATLEIIRQRLVDQRSGDTTAEFEGTSIDADDYGDDNTLDEMLEGDVVEVQVDVDTTDPAALDSEIRELDRFIEWARTIKVDAKSLNLLGALEIGFERMVQNGAARKALIFTESRRTQTYLRDFLQENGYAGKIALFNGSNNDEQAREITSRWVEANRSTGKVNDSRDVNARTAIIDHFCNEAEILIATEAAAEGVNLQFCSLVVNYDLPWNPQRIEQRIGRCHRYGQKYDVVVVNFVNNANAADQRTFELLEQKFQLFSGVFGVSDEVMGSIESGIDFERRIFGIYQTCRTPGQIEAAFNELQALLDATIKSRIMETQQLLFDNFDEDIHQRLRLNLKGAQLQLDKYGKQFWALTKHMLCGSAQFNDNALVFTINETPPMGIKTGTYHLISKNEANVEGEYLYRPSHPLGQRVLSSARELDTPLAEVEFDVTHHPTKLSLAIAMIGQSGWLAVDKLIVKSVELEEYHILAGFTDAGRTVDQEVFEKLFQCGGRVISSSVQGDPPRRLTDEAELRLRAALQKCKSDNELLLNEERERLYRWADDMILAAERDLVTTKQSIRDANRRAKQARTLQEQVELQKEIRELEQQQRNQRKRIFEVTDAIEMKRDGFIEAIEERLRQNTSTQNLFTIRWRAV